MLFDMAKLGLEAWIAGTLKLVPTMNLEELKKFSSRLEKSTPSQLQRNTIESIENAVRYYRELTEAYRIALDRSLQLRAETPDHEDTIRELSRQY